VAKKLSAVNSDPVEGRVRKYVAMREFNVVSIKGVQSYMLFQDNFCVKKYWWRVG
jgi:hypothetical protein